MLMINQEGEAFEVCNEYIDIASKCNKVLLTKILNKRN